MRLQRAVFLALAALCWSAAARADEPQVTARVEPSRVEEGGQVNLILQIQGASQAVDELPNLSQLPGFVLAAGPSRSSYFQWINGKTSSSETYTYTLLPQGKGARTISPLAVRIGGKVYRTELLRVDVVPPGSLGGGSPQGGQGNPPPGGSPFADPGVRRRLAPPPTVPALMLVEASADKTEVYPGEQVTLLYKVDTQFDIAQMSIKDQPTYEGFWVEDLKTDEKYGAHTVRRAEGNFIEYTVLKKALFPTNPGTFTIPPVTFHFAVRRQGTDPFDSFFFQPTESLFRSSQPVTIRVKALPEEGRPPEFTGAVGRFDLKVEADRKQARVNDAVGLKIEVEGQGNIDTLGSPVLPETHDFKRYEPKVQESRSAKGGTLVGSKTWEYVLIPLAAGDQEIPPVRFAYFDPSVAQYRVLKSEPIRLDVARGNLSEMAAQPAANRTEIPILGSDIRYIKLSSRRIEDQGVIPYSGGGFLALLAAPLLANMSLLVYRQRRIARAGSESLLRRRRAGRVARKRLGKARSHLAPGQSRQFYQDLAAAMTSYLADKGGVSPSGLTYDRIEEILSERGVQPETGRRFRRCLETCDFARFAPAASGKEEMERALEEALSAVAELEGQVKSE
jgi:oxygen tolerance protein BatD